MVALLSLATGPKSNVEGQHTQMLQRWTEVKTHICRCGAFPRVEPTGARRWGCIICDTLTHHSEQHFRRRAILHLQEAAEFETQFEFSFT